MSVDLQKVERKFQKVMINYKIFCILRPKISNFQLQNVFFFIVLRSFFAELNLLKITKQNFWSLNFCD